MDHQQQHDQQITLATLQGDIRLATKELEKLQAELEQLSGSRNTAFAEFDTQIKRKKAELEQLSKEGASTADLNRLTMLSLDDMQKRLGELQSEGETLIKAAEQEVLSIHRIAEGREKAVTDREENVQNLYIDVEKREKIVSDDIKSLNSRILDVSQRENVVQVQSLEIEKSKEDAERAIAGGRELLDDINRQLTQKRMELQQIDISIQAKTKEAEVIGVQAQALLEDVTRREIVVARKEKILDEKAIEQNNETIRLADKERTIARAYEETIRRGGTIN